ncbi:MAG: hypothetical protein ABSF69_25205 [Polyangiaceae bacterium]
MTGLLQTLSGIAGVVLVLIGLCAGRTETGRVQSIVLNLWVTFTDFGERATSRHARLVRGTAGMALAALDWVFGTQLLAARSVWTAIWTSISSAVLALYLGIGLLLRGIVRNAPWVPPTFAEKLLPYAAHYRLIIFGGAVPSAALLAVALWPALLKRPIGFFRPALASFPLLMLARAQWNGFHLFMTSHETLHTAIRDITRTEVTGFGLIAPFILLGTLTDLGTLKVTRWALRKCERGDSWPSGLAALAGLIPLGFILSGAPIYVLRDVGGRYVTIPLLLLTVAIPMNVFDIMFVVGLAIWIFVLVAHKLLWPITSGLIERVYELIPSRLGMVGSGLVLLGFSGWQTVKALIKDVIDVVMAGAAG